MEIAREIAEESSEGGGRQGMRLEMSAMGEGRESDGLERAAG
jgi:hypothetical protein